jgi:hypothetical protein
MNARIAKSNTASYEELEARIVEIIQRTKSYEVLHEDLVGEGPGGWHSAPRYPGSKVNCIIWLQLVLAEAYGYGKSADDRLLIMDRLRYYKGAVGFSLRKHYIDHWLAIEPEPLLKVSLSEWATPLVHRSVLEPAVFLAHNRFPLPLYQMERTTFEVEFYERAGIIAAAQLLPRRCYIGFAVPGKAYLDRFAGQSGPMGLVHALVLDLTGEATNRRPRSLNQCIIHHASTSAHKVLSEPLASYVERSSDIHSGYALYQLDHNWDPLEPIALDQEASELQARERQLALVEQRFIPRAR